MKRRSKLFLISLTVAVLFCCGCAIICFIVASSHNSKVVIIKAAGYEEGKQPEGPDAITEATSTGRNVHVITQALQDSLNQWGIATEVVLFNEADRIKNLSKNKSVQLIVFAGPAYSSQFPAQLKKTVPKVQSDILKRDILCTCMTTCRFMDSGRWTVRSFNQHLNELGINTMDGLVIHHEFEDKYWTSKVQIFADHILKQLGGSE